MRKITDIYIEYKIPPTLQEHMLRVAGITQWIVEHSSMPIDQEVITAALLHDMGNILKIKFSDNFSLYARYSDTEKEYWNGVKSEFQQKYGSDEDEATLKIVKEISTNQKLEKLIEGNHFKVIDEIVQDDSMERMVLKYADMRVGTHGILPLQERLDDFAKRNKIDLGDEHLAAAYIVEQKIFEHLSANPEDITDTTIAPYIEKLKEFSF